MILLYLFCAISLTLADTLDCCETKKNGDTIYKLVQVDKDITKRYNCKDGCVYEDTNEDGNRFCFRYGGEHISTCDVGEIESVLTISENGQEVKQTVSFNNYTEILTINVPPHISVTQENFAQATTTFDTKTNINVIKSNNSCVLSDIPSYINVTGMPEYFQQVKDGTVEWDNENKEIAYDVKMVKSVVSPDERKALTPAFGSLCNNEVIKKTENKRISKDNYKKLSNDEIIFMGDELENTQSYCSLNTSCTSNGPASCGNYGWYNPLLNRYITMHQVSSKSLCITCCVETSPQCNCPEDFPEVCPCSKITTKEIFMDCLLGNGAGKYKLNFQDSVHTFSATTQLLTYNSKNDERSVKIEVPSHGDVSETTVLMHAHPSGYWHTDSLNNNMMVKVGSTCYIRTLPQNVFPVDIATGIKDIDAGDFTLKPENEKKKHTIIRTDKPLTFDEKQNLNLEIKEICKNSEIFKHEEIDVAETEFQTVNDGGIINLKNNEKTRGCSLEIRATTNNNSQGCWRWPNSDEGPEFDVHGLVSSVIEVKCCNDPCCKDSGYCECKDITDIASFHQCFAQSERICKCGKKKDNKRVVGGTPTKVNEYPWMAGLSERERDTYYFCGGTLVAAQWVVTASHCIFYKNEVFVTLGDHDKTDDAESVIKTIKVEKIIGHPNYYYEALPNDFALLKLSEIVDLNTYTPACLPAAGTDYTGQNGWIVGWGDDQMQRQVRTDVLNELELPIVSDSVCQQAFIDKGFDRQITSDMMCAGGAEGKDGCFGDSGGPFTVDTAGQHFLVGVVSWGEGCARDGLYGVYAEVAMFREWMDQQIANNGGADYCPVYNSDGAPDTHVDCYIDPLGEGKCPENAGCFNDELGLYGPIGQQGFCHCFLGFYLDDSTDPPTCRDMRGGGNCDENGNSYVCYEADRHFEWCPYCSVKKLHEDHGGVLSLGHYVSGEGDFYSDDPQIFENGDDENCPWQRSTQAFWYCWYDYNYADIVPLDTVLVQWMEPEICSFFIYAYTPLACCFADPVISEECWM